MASAILSASTRDRAPSRFAVWSMPGPVRGSVKLVVEREGAGRRAGRDARAGTAQPGQTGGAGTGDHPPVAAGRAVGKASVGDHDARAGPAGDLPRHVLQPGVLGGAVGAVEHERLPGRLPLAANAEPETYRGLGALPLAVELGVGALCPARYRERALSPPRHRRLPPHRLMCESRTNLI